MNALLSGVKWVARRKAMYFHRARPGRPTRDRSVAEGLIEPAEAIWKEAGA